MSRQPSSPAKPRRSIFYADPDYPGRSRHEECFKRDHPRQRLNLKAKNYQRTDGPCWICTRATQDRTIWLALRSMLDGLEGAAAAVERASDQGFLLAKEVRCGCFAGSIERGALEATIPDLVRAFREAWEQAATAAAYPGGNRDPLFTTTAYGVLGLGYVDGRLNERDPRRYLSRLDPTRAAVVHATDIEQVSGRLGNISRLIRRISSERWAEVCANRGTDEDEPLRVIAETHGGSPKRIAKTALTFLKPSGIPTKIQSQAAAIANKMGQRKFTGKPLPGG